MSFFLSDEANAECEKHVNSTGRWMMTNGSSYAGMTYLVSMPIFNLTRDPE